ncbi:hypothetical protein ACLB2K_010241 [Fragaria x ananassa]
MCLYFRRAGTSLFILSKNLAQYINVNSASLKTYAHDDVSVGSWMMVSKRLILMTTVFAVVALDKARFVH